MFKTRIAAVIIAGVALTGAAGNSARAQQAPEGSVYTTHTPPTGGCPALDWHIAVGPNHTLTGMVGVEGMEDIWKMTGSSTPDRHFHLDGQELGGKQRTGTVDGTVDAKGRLVLTMANISGGPSPCNNKTIYLRWFRNGNAWNPNSVAGGGG